MPPHTSRAAMMAAHHGQFGVGCTRFAATIPPIAATYPIERSISPRSRTKPSPIASTTKTALWSNRLTRLPADRKTWFGLTMVKTTVTATRAMATGRTPASPLLARASHARRYWPSDWARISGGMTSTAAAVRSGALRASVTVSGTSPAGLSSEANPQSLSWLEPDASTSRLDPPVVMKSTTLCRSNDESQSSATIRPSRSTAIRSATSKTSFRL